MNKKLVYVSGGNRFGEHSLFRDRGWDVTAHIEIAHLVVFTGGADINPATYGEYPHPTTYFDEGRDDREVTDFKVARGLGIPIFGICRGAQLVCSLLGGSLFQHAPHPGPGHLTFTDDGRKMMMSSCHHQMMRPTKAGIVKAWTVDLASTHEHMVGQTLVEVHLEDGREPEVVYWPDHKVLGVQGHPEFYQGDPTYDEFRSYCYELIDQMLQAHEATEGVGVASGTPAITQAPADALVAA